MRRPSPAPIRPYRATGSSPSRASQNRRRRHSAVPSRWPRNNINHCPANTRKKFQLSSELQQGSFIPFGPIWSRYPTLLWARTFKAHSTPLADGFNPLGRPITNPHQAAANGRHRHGGPLRPNRPIGCRKPEWPIKAALLLNRSAYRRRNAPCGARRACCGSRQTRRWRPCRQTCARQRSRRGGGPSTR